MISIVLYLLLYISAPYIASFYNEPELSLVTKWIGLNLIISGFSTIQLVKLMINIDFKTQAKVSFIAVLLSGSIGILLAYKGLGVWALVFQSLSNNLLTALFLWLFVKWSPGYVFSWESFRTLFFFGSKILLSGLLNTIYINMYSLVLGKRYSAMDVGFYNRSFQFAYFPSTSITGIMTRVFFPLQCEMQDDDERLKSFFIQYLRMLCYIIFPLMIGLAVLSKPLILLLLTDKWLPSADILSILCFAYMWYPVMIINSQILKVKGRSDYYLRAEVIKKMIAIIILLITLHLGIKTLCWGIVLYNFFDMAISIYYTKKVFCAGYVEQICNIIPLFLLSLLTGSITYASMYFVYESLLCQFFIGCFVALTMYVLLSFIFRLREIINLFSYVKNAAHYVRK